MLGKLSGRAGFAARAAELGYRLDDRSLARAFAGFQALAASGTRVGDEEVRALCEPGAAPASARALALR